jgi:glycosyltransferase 2 family protein
LLPGLIISAISLAVVFYFADIQVLFTALQQADYRLVLAGLLTSLVWLLVRGLAWRTLLQDKATYRAVFFTLNEGYLMNNILPFRLGEVGRAFLMGRKSRLGFWQVLSSILIERSLDLALAAGLLLVTIPFVVGAQWALQGAVISGTLVVVALFLLFYLARRRDWTEKRYNSVRQRFPLVQKVGGERFPAFLNGLSVLTERGYFLKALIWMVLDWVIAVFQYYLVLLAFFPNAPILWAAFALGVAAIGIAAPSSPGAIGVMEAAIVGALSLFNLDLSVALAFALTVHIMQYLLTGVLGAYGLARDGETIRGLYQSARGMLNKTTPP